MCALITLDPSVFNADPPVSFLRDLRVMGYHHDRLVEFLAGHLQKIDHFIAGPAVQISVGSSQSRSAGFVISALAIATLCCCPPERWLG